MDIKGFFADRAPAEVFLELATREASGLLRIERQGVHAELTLANGRVQNLRWNDRPPNERIGQLLMNKQIISIAQLQECLQQQERTLRRVGEILVDFRYATHEQIAAAAREQTMEGVVGFLSWREGRYRFYRGGTTAESLEFAPIELLPLVASSIATNLEPAGGLNGTSARRHRPAVQVQIFAFAKTMGMYGIVLVTCALALQLQLLERFNLFRGPKPLIVESDATRQAVANFVQARLERTLEIYRWLEGRYPERLEDLVRAGLVAPSDIHYPFHSYYEYSTGPSGYELHRPIR